MDIYLKSKAIKLRRRGKTYSDINHILQTNIPKSTLSGWFKGIVLSKNSSERLERNISKKLKTAQLMGLESIFMKRQKYLHEILNGNLAHIKHFDSSSLKLMLSILYLAEGAKYKSSNSPRLGSTDPKIIQLYLKLLRNCYEIDDQKIRIRIQCRYDQNLEKLELYWRKIVGIPNVRFYPTYVDKRTIGSPTKKVDYMGVCTVDYLDTRVQLDLEILSRLVIDSIIGNEIDDDIFLAQWLKPLSDGKII